MNWIGYKRKLCLNLLKKYKDNTENIYLKKD